MAKNEKCQQFFDRNKEPPRQCQSSRLEGVKGVSALMFFLKISIEIEAEEG